MSIIHEMVYNQNQVKLPFYPLITFWSLSTIEFTSKRLIRNYLQIRALKPFSSRSQHIREPLLLYKCEFLIYNSHSQPLRIAGSENASICPNYLCTLANKLNNPSIHRRSLLLTQDLDHPSYDHRLT